MSTAGPSTSIPFATSDRRRAVTKYWVGLSTDAVSENGRVRSGSTPRSSRREEPGKRRRATAGVEPAAPVVIRLLSVRPL